MHNRIDALIKMHQSLETTTVERDGRRHLVISISFIRVSEEQDQNFLLSYIFGAAGRASSEVLIIRGRKTTTATHLSVCFYRPNVSGSSADF